MNKVILKKKNRKRSSLRGKRQEAYGVTFHKDGEEVSRQFELLKKRANLIANQEAAQATANWNAIVSRRENLRAETLKSLKKAIEKLKVAREEIHKAFRSALKMKTAGDEIADEFITSIADLAAYTNAEFCAKQALVRPEKSNSLHACRIQTPDGEIHCVPQEFDINGSSANCKDFDKAEFKKTMKKEAAKPLLLLRAE
jgi:hypothetical protein